MNILKKVVVLGGVCLFGLALLGDVLQARVESKVQNEGVSKLEGMELCTHLAKQGSSASKSIERLEKCEDIYGNGGILLD